MEVDAEMVVHIAQLRDFLAAEQALEAFACTSSLVFLFDDEVLPKFGRRSILGGSVGTHDGHSLARDCTLSISGIFEFSRIVNGGAWSVIVLMSDQT